jgi:RNA polymerase sigma factor for flagellar operon FliA
MLTPSTFPTASSNHRPLLSNEIAGRYTTRIRRHAARVARRLPRHVVVSDLVSAGYVGLVDAFERFDTTRMLSFDAYIDHRIRGAILDELRDNDPLTRDQRVFARRLTAATHACTIALRRAPESFEIARQLGMTLTAYHSQLSKMNATSSRSAAIAFDEEAAEVEGAQENRPDDLVERSERCAMLKSAIEQLSARHRFVLKMHYDEGHTLREIADALGVTESRVSQIHSEILGRLRTLVSDG